MYKHVMLGLVVAAAAFVFNGGVVSAQAAPPVTICHATNSVANPYNQQTVSQSAVDGQGNNDHTNHTGPLASSPEVAQDLKNNHEDWGDIIPPIPGVLPGGLNWTAEGQAMYANGCNYVQPNLDQPLITFDVACDQNDVVVSLTNEGQADGSAFVNDQEVQVAAGATVSVEFDSDENIEVVIDQQTVFDEAVTCGGRGAGPVDPQVEAPVAGVNAGGGAVLGATAALFASIATAAYGALRLHKSRG